MISFVGRAPSIPSVWHMKFYSASQWKLQKKSETNARPLPNVRENLMAIMFIKQSAFAFFPDLFFFVTPVSAQPWTTGVFWEHNFFVLSVSHSRFGHLEFGCGAKVLADETIG